MDKLIKCVSCHTVFTFSEGEQAFFAKKGLTVEPRRCRACRPHKAVPMFPTVCAQCAQDTTVPFQPEPGKLVFCAHCYQEGRTS